MSEGRESHEKEVTNEDSAAGMDATTNDMTGIGGEQSNGAQTSRTGASEDGREDSGDDLFGDEGDENDAASAVDRAPRQLDDAELDSGDDEGREDRAQHRGDDEEQHQQQFEDHEILSMDVEVARQPVPEPSDGEMYLLKVPAFMSIEAEPWQVTTFQPPKTDHHSRKPASATFSAFNTAMTTMRWRHSPSDHSLLQSNARINRWSDGTLTVQLASDPHIQYEVDGNPLAPPQRNPKIPTPISATGRKPGGRAGQSMDERYDQKNDAFTYLVAPVEAAEALRVTHKITAGLSIQQPDNAEDDAIERLQAALALAANATKVAGASGHLEVTEVDPEEQRRLAEQAERQAMRDKRKRENAQERERLRTDRALGRAGISSGRYGGLNVGMLEDDEMEGGRGRPQAGKPRPKPRRRRNSEYSDDEDYGNKRFTNREDDYDQEDDFVARSDEEELVEDDDDPDDGIIEEPRERTPKRDRPRSAPGDNGRIGDDEDAEGEIDEDIPQVRSKRRRVVDDEDEE